MTECPADLPPMHTDAEIVQQILGNLIDNACKYSRGAADERIWLRASQNGSGTVFEVEDRGPGVPAREQRGIFQAFRRGRTADVTAGRRRSWVGARPPLGATLGRHARVAAGPRRRRRMLSVANCLARWIRVGVVEMFCYGGFFTFLLGMLAALKHGVIVGVVTHDCAVSGNGPSTRTRRVGRTLSTWRDPVGDYRLCVVGRVSAR